jgi:antitoxin component of MazEF toxin-antitoxin module
MAQEECAKGRVRKLQQQANGSTTVALPVELVRSLGWKNKQKVEVKKRGDTLVIGRVVK